VTEITEDMIYGAGMSDPEYLREMARLCDANVGPPVREHSDRLRAIAERIEAMSRAFEREVHSGVRD
jgi:hypothetical protein